MPLIPMQITCEECGVRRNECNNWFSTFYSATGDIVVGPLNLELVVEYTKADYMMSAAEAAKYKVHCGESCVIKYLSQNLAGLHKEVHELSCD